LKIVPRDEPVEVDEHLQIVLAGDADAYGYFVRTYQRRVYGMAFSLLRDSGEAASQSDRDRACSKRLEERRERLGPRSRPR
jgi:hypothetical protein